MRGAFPVETGIYESERRRREGLHVPNIRLGKQDDPLILPGTNDASLNFAYGGRSAESGIRNLGELYQWLSYGMGTLLAPSEYDSQKEDSAPTTRSTAAEHASE